MPKIVSLVEYFGPLRRPRHRWSGRRGSSYRPGLTYLGQGCAIAGLCVPLACGAAPASVTPPSHPNTVAVESPEPTLSLSLDQQALRERLVRHVESLATKIGERNSVKDWELAEASDYVSSEWEKMGLVVERSGFVHDGRTYSNLSVLFEGSSSPNEVVLVMAGYDSRLGSRGESAAMATAILLETARHLSQTRHERSVRLWALAMSEHIPDGAPLSAELIATERGRTKTGSLLPTPERIFREKFELVVLLKDLGTPILGSAGDKGVRLGFNGPERSALTFFHEGLEGEGITILDTSAAESATQPHRTEISSFVEAGVPVVTIAGASAGAPVDADFSAILGSRLPFALGRAAGVVLTNDGMLTPEVPKDR